ncbi:EamA family transporter [Dongia sp.]|uniref:EamA family transporter n=1 Tax=Dongia sp. TaxID=1977262 RepID=UPI0035B2D5D3
MRAPMPSSKSLLWAIGALIIAMISVQAGAAFAKTLFPIIGAEGTVVLRLSLAALMLGLALRVWRVRIGRSNWHLALIYGVNLGAMNFLYYLAVARIPVGIAAALEFTGPLAVAIFASRSKLDLLWAALALAGIALLLPVEGLGSSLDPLGVIYALGAGLGWALYIFTGRRAGHAFGTPAPAVGMIVAALVTLPLGAVQAVTVFADIHLLLLALAVAALSSAVPFAFEMVSLRHLPPQAYGTLTSMEPAIGALSGLVILREMLPASQWLAIGLVVLASVGTTLTVRARRGGEEKGT